MARAQTRWIAACVTAVACTVTFKWLSDSLREVNEPGPTSVSKADLESELSNGRVQVRIYELFYINRDFNAFIFVGLVEPSGASKVNLSLQEILQSEQYRSIYPSSFGEVRRFKQGHKSLWGIVVSTTAGEWEQGHECFMNQWALAKQKMEKREPG